MHRDVFFNYRKLRRERMLRKMAAMRAAKERKRLSYPMARRKPETMIEAADILKSETVATDRAKGHSDQRLVRAQFRLSKYKPAFKSEHENTRKPQ